MKRRLCIGILCLLCLMVVIMAFPVSAAEVSGTCGENLNWVLEDGVLTISGSGAIRQTPWWDHSDEITKVVIEDGVTTIGWHAFYRCEALESVVISGSVTEIGERAFYECNALKTVEFGQGLQTIGYGAFSGCSSLTTLTFPESLTKLGEAAFSGCTSLKELYFLGDEPDVGGNAFANVTASAYYLPENESWDRHSLAGSGSIRAQPYFEEPKCGDNLLWHYADGVLTISGTGDMYTPADLDMWAEHRLDIKKVVIESGVTGISRQAFSFHTALEEVIIPETVTSIGGTAFAMCTSLKKVTIPNSVKTIGGGCISHCAELEEVHIGTGVTRIEGSIFSECPKVKIYFYGNAPEIGFPWLTNLAVTAYYPAGNESWTEEVRKRCGENIIWVDICLDGHKEVPVTGKPATCTEDGLTDGKQCSVCSQVTVKQEKIPATGHSFGTWVTVKAATEQEEGRQERTCSSCGKKEEQKLSKLPPQITETPTQVPTAPPTTPPTEAPTQPPTEAPTAPSTEAPTNPSTTPSTQAPTEPSATQTPPTEPAGSKPAEDGNGLIILWISLGVVAIGGGAAAFLIIKRKK